MGCDRAAMAPWALRNTSSASADVADEVQPRIFETSEKIRKHKHIIYIYININLLGFSTKFSTFLHKKTSIYPQADSWLFLARFGFSGSEPPISTRCLLAVTSWDFEHVSDGSLSTQTGQFHPFFHTSGADFAVETTWWLHTTSFLNIWTVFWAWRAVVFCWAARFGADFYFNLPRLWLWQFSVSALVLAGINRWSFHGDRFIG